MCSSSDAVSGLNDEELGRITVGSPFHDLGRSDASAEVLNWLPVA